MTDKKSSNSRRKLLKSIAAGSGAVIAGNNLPENWARPVVDSVMLPAHAQTSPTNYSGSTTTTQEVRLETDSLFAQARDSLIPEAAADMPTTYKTSWCILPVNDTQADVTFLVHEDIVEPLGADLFTARVTVGVETTMMKSEGCSNDDADASDWLDNLGLVKDAQAGCGALITLEGLNINDSFKFVTTCWGGITVNDFLEVGDTCPTAVMCKPF